MVRRIEKRKRLEEEGELQTSVRPVEIPFHQLINAMLDGSTPLPPRYLYRLSDLSEVDLYQLKKNWSSVPVWRRQAMMEDLQELVEKDMMLSFEALCRMALLDEDPRVRFGAVQTLIANECEAQDLVDVYLRMMKNDPDAKVRAIATSALGHYVYLGELETLQPEIKLNLEEHLLEAYRNAGDPEIQCCALEALGYSNRDEIAPLIEGAYNSTEATLQSSALVAMGRSSLERWKPQVMSMLTHSNPSIRAEAARAAGELGMTRPHLFDLVEDANQDVCAASLWALSQIGGKGVRKILQERLQEADEDEEIKFLESAIDNLDFNEGNHGLDILDLEEAGSEDLYTLNAEGDDDEIDADELFDYDDEDDEDFDDEDELEEEDEYEDFLDEEEDSDDFYFDEDEDEDDDEDLWH